MKGKDFNAVTVLFVPLLALFVIFPTVSLVCNVSYSGLSTILHDRYFWFSVRTTFAAAIGATAMGLVMAVGFCYFHVFHRTSLVYRIANLFNDLPIALPHTVAGLALLMAFGRKNFGFLGRTGLAFNLFAVIIAMFFVLYPMCARSLASGVDQIDQEMIFVARTLGDSAMRAYFKVVLPNIREAVFSAVVLSFSRALSEFAVVTMFGGNLPGKTQTMAAYVFIHAEAGDTEAAIAASVFCILLSLCIVGVLSAGRRARRA